MGSFIEGIIRTVVMVIVAITIAATLSLVGVVWLLVSLVRHVS